MSTRLNWRFLLGEFVVIVLGVLVALWVDQEQASRRDALLEVEYLESFLIDLDTDLAQFDSADAWSLRQEESASIVLALYEGRELTQGIDEIVHAVESAGWQYVPTLSRNTIDDLRSTGNLRLLRDASLRRNLATYYALAENAGVPIAENRDRMWTQYDAAVGRVLRPEVRLRVLQNDDSFGKGITSAFVTPGELPSRAELVRALRAVPEFEIAAGDVLYLSISNRATVDVMREAALELRGLLEARLAGDALER
jgi:hypothetical protein